MNYCITENLRNKYDNAKKYYKIISYNQLLLSKFMFLDIYYIISSAFSSKKMELS